MQMQLRNTTSSKASSASGKASSAAVPVPVAPVRSSVRASAIAPPPPSGQGLTYKQAGVDIDAGDELVRRIKKMNPSMNTGFNGFVPFGDSYLVSGTDGVGTKLKLAFDINKHDTVSIVRSAAVRRGVVLSMHAGAPSARGISASSSSGRGKGRGAASRSVSRGERPQLVASHP